jgi:hypothetical protein
MRRLYNQSFLLQFETFRLVMSLFLTILTKISKEEEEEDCEKDDDLIVVGGASFEGAYL